MATGQDITYTYDDIGSRLRHARKAIGVTQLEFAARAGVHWQSVSRVEQGHRKIVPELLEVLYGEGIDLNWIIAGTGQMRRTHTDAGYSTDSTVDYWQKSSQHFQSALQLVYERLTQSARSEITAKVFQGIDLGSSDDQPYPRADSLSMGISGFAEKPSEKP